MIDLGADNSFNPDAAMTRGDLAKALAVLLSNDPNLSAQSLKGSLVSLAGEVVIVHLDKDKTLPLANSCPVEIGDTVKTGDKGKAKIDFPDGSSLLMENNTELLFKKMQGKAYIKKSGTPGTGVDFLEVELHKGQLFGGLSSFRRSIGDVALNSRLNGSLVSSGNKFDLLAAADSEVPWYKTAEKKKVKVVVDMPWGVSAIRGSFWSNLCTDQLNTMTLLEGSGQLSAGNKTRELSPNQGSQIASEGAQPGVTSSMSSAEQMDWAREKDWVKSTAANMNYNQEYGLKENAGNSLKDIINNSMDNLYDGGSSGGGDSGGGCGGC